MTNKIVVAKEGYNALTETNPNNLYFSSDYNTLKYYKSGSQTVTVNFADFYYSEYWGFPFDITWYYHKKEVTVSMSELGGFIPVFLAYAKFTASSDYCMCPLQFADAGYSTFLQAYSSENGIRLTVNLINQSNIGTQDYYFNYKVFMNGTYLDF